MAIYQRNFHPVKSEVDEKLAAHLMRNSYNKLFAAPEDARCILSGEVDHVQYEVWQSGMVVYVVYPGSNQAKDWLRHIKFTRCKLPPTRQNDRHSLRFHRAWMADAESTEDRIHNACQEAKDRDFLVCCLGHSYGGPLSAYIAYGLVCNGWRVAHRSWGAPAPGNRAFARAFAAAVPDQRRYANPFDIVTRVPFTATHTTNPIRVRAGWPAHSAEKYFRWTIGAL